MKLCLLERLQRFIFDNSLSSSLNIVIKDPYFVSWKNIREKRLISQPWKKKVDRYEYAIYPLLLQRIWGSPTLSLMTFPVFFKWRQIVNRDMLRLTKAWTAINRLSIIWKSDLTDKMKRSFLQAAVTSILLYGCTTWTLTKRLEKKLDGNYTRMLRAILNKSWQQHPTRHQLYGHLPPITKTIQVRRTKHAGHCWRSRDELIRDVLLWIPTHGRAKAGRPARTYIQQLCEDTGCCPEDLPRAMNDREEWRERVRDIRAASTIWWWWWWWHSNNSL